MSAMTSCFCSLSSASSNSVRMTDLNQDAALDDPKTRFPGVARPLSQNKVCRWQRERGAF